MNVISHGESACDKIRGYLDSYISNELLVETNHEVLRHLESCPSCSAEVEARSRVRTRLRAAVESQKVPADLTVKIRQMVHRQQSRFLPTAAWSLWAMAAAAAVVLSVGVWVTRARTGMPDSLDVADRAGQDVFIQRVSRTVSKVLRVGLGDHIHCAVFRKYPKNPPAVAQLAETMGPVFQGLVPLVKASVPDRFRILMAHQCSYGTRRFIHVTLSDGANLMSLVIARKEPGESLDGLSPSTRASGVPVYQGQAERYEIAGFETAQYLAFVISDMNAGNNLQMASNIAPPVHDFLAKL
jgi:putative zinc finger protein